MVAARGDRKRACWTAVTAAALIVGGILSSMFVRDQYQDRIVERDRAEAAAARTGQPAPQGSTAALLRKEIRVIPYLLHIFTWAGCLLLMMAVAELRGWRFFDPVAEQPPPPKIT
jgi:hypothetical protein